MDDAARIYGRVYSLAVDRVAIELAGLDSSSALLSTAGIGLVNLVTTLLGMYLIDRVGRKSLMLIGSVGYIVSLATVAWAFASITLRK